MAKRSDLLEALKSPTQRDPLFLSTGARKNVRIGSLDSASLKPWRLCSACNNARTQPHDRAWEQLSGHLASRGPPIAPGAVVRADRVFPYDTTRRMLDVHLYFAKQFGCVAASEATVAIDLAPFSAAILSQKACPLLWLRFGCGRNPDGRVIVGRTSATAWRAPDGSIAAVEWIYQVHRHAVHVMYIADGKAPEELDGAWHPSRGTNKLVIADIWR